MTLLRTALVATVLVAPLASQSTTPAPSYEERDFLSRVRRLTVEGKRAGEGYWAPDGKRLVFQSEREPGNPFYQIYVLDLASGKKVGEFNAGAPLSASPAIAAGKLVIGSQDGKLYCLG